MNDNALNYEWLMRRAHQCNRYGVAGADADTFRNLEKVATEYTSEKKEETLAAYMVSAGEVSAYIKTATTIVKRKYEKQLSDEQYNELDDIEVLLIKPDWDKIVEAITRAGKIMLDLGLQIQ